MAGLVQPARGQVWRHPALRCHPFRRVGYVCQNPNYQLFMDTVEREVAFQSDSVENTEYYLALFGLSPLRHQHPHSLSEGQKRLVTIAAIAAMRPDVLLLDEPTVGQDHQALKRLLAALLEIQERWSTALVIVTHDYRCATALGSRYVWIEQGRVKAEGGTELLRLYYGRFLQPHGKEPADARSA